MNIYLWEFLIHLFSNNFKMNSITLWLNKWIIICTIHNWLNGITNRTLLRIESANWNHPISQVFFPCLSSYVTQALYTLCLFRWKEFLNTRCVRVFCVNVRMNGGGFQMIIIDCCCLNTMWIIINKKQESIIIHIVIDQRICFPSVSRWMLFTYFVYYIFYTSYLDYYTVTNKQTNRIQNRARRSHW